ncbi:hypothetical protein Leryth_011341 [Lithospermum erythrorhizon]|nr:hypothetical protein Leryth_011341 [Lithospermum erythrorhizon]
MPHFSLSVEGLGFALAKTLHCWKRKFHWRRFYSDSVSSFRHLMPMLLTTC